MADNIKQHVSIDERLRWEKVVQDFGIHLGSGGPQNHPLGNGTVAGFSTNDYTNAEKDKLAGVEDGALNNPHPPTHPYTMITGLEQISWTAEYWHLKNIPTGFWADGGNSDTVGGIRITINSAAPSNPQNNKEIWINPDNRLLSIYRSGTWVVINAVFAP